MSKVLVVGGASVDKIIYMDKLPEPKAGTIFSKGSQEEVGSTGCGKVLNLQRLGMETTFHAMIGSDRAGDLIKNVIENAGINFIYDIDEKGTEEHVNIMDNDGNRISIYTQYATFEPEIDLEKFESIIKENDYIVLNIINYSRKLIPLVKKYNKEIWCDLHDYDGKNEYYSDYIENADYIFMSSDCMENYEDFMRKLIEDKKKLVICTHGKKGVTAISNDGQYIEMPIIDKYERIDTNGAGDSFFAGFLYAHSKGYSLEKSLQYGTIVAGLCINSSKLANQNLSEEFIKSEYQKYYM